MSKNQRRGNREVNKPKKKNRRLSQRAGSLGTT
jgi:hypothetical protein